MFQAILDFIKGFTPDSKLPTGEYLARVASLSAVLLIIATAVYFAVSGTVLGARWGLVRTVTDITNLSHVEFNKDQRVSWQGLTQLRENDDTIKGAFIAVLYNTDTGNILTKDEHKKSQSMLWVVSIPGNKFNSIDIIETAINKIKPTYQEKFNEKRECFSSRLNGEPLQILRRGIENLKSTPFAVCPIFTKKGDFLIAASFLLIELPPDPLAADRETKPSEIIDYEGFTLWGYQDRLRRATALIDDNFRRFDVPHIFYYK
jgi:hypothetical protein